MLFFLKHKKSLDFLTFFVPCVSSVFCLPTFLSFDGAIEGVSMNNLGVRRFVYYPLLVTMLSESKFCIPALIVDPTVGGFDVIALDAEGGCIGVCEGEDAGVGHVVSPSIVVCGG